MLFKNLSHLVFFTCSTWHYLSTFFFLLTPCSNLYKVANTTKAGHRQDKVIINNSTCNTWYFNRKMVTWWIKQNYNSRAIFVNVQGNLDCYCILYLSLPKIVSGSFRGCSQNQNHRAGECQSSPKCPSRAPLPPGSPLPLGFCPRAEAVQVEAPLLDFLLWIFLGVTMSGVFSPERPHFTDLGVLRANSMSACLQPASRERSRVALLCVVTPECSAEVRRHQVSPASCPALFSWEEGRDPSSGPPPSASHQSVPAAWNLWNMAHFQINWSQLHHFNSD